MHMLIMPICGLNVMPNIFAQTSYQHANAPFSFNSYLNVFNSSSKKAESSFFQKVWRTYFP